MNKGIPGVSPDATTLPGDVGCITAVTQEQENTALPDCTEQTSQSQQAVNCHRSGEKTRTASTGDLPDAEGIQGKEDYGTLPPCSLKTWFT